MGSLEKEMVATWRCVAQRGAAQCSEVQWWQRSVDIHNKHIDYIYVDIHDLAQTSVVYVPNCVDIRLGQNSGLHVHVLYVSKYGNGEQPVRRNGSEI